jgi:hypothetical protein
MGVQTNQLRYIQVELGSEELAARVWAKDTSGLEPENKVSLLHGT